MSKLEPKLNTPTILVVFGVTGDLMARKILPAIYNLYSEKRVPDLFKVVGFARRDIGDAGLKNKVNSTLISKNKKPLKEFEDIFSYVQGNFADLADYKKLAGFLKQLDDEWGVCTNKLFYLAVPPEYYENIFDNLDQSGLTEPCSDETGWTKVLVEKPFGANLDHAIQLDNQLARLFKDEQVYRVDHYLAKDTIQNILSFRFLNNFLQLEWNSKGFERIDLRIFEHIDIEGRGGFYDPVGALLDVGQNHLLQMLALVTMDQPKDFSSGGIREERSKILEKLQPVRDIEQDTVTGQYDGYKKEANVAKDSRTETYFKLKTQLDHPDWVGVPIYMEAGKAMKVEDKSIKFTYRHPKPCMCDGNEHYRNELMIEIAPEPSIRAKFWVRKPGTKNEIESQELTFKYALSENSRYEAEYTQLLSDAMAGDQTLFVSSRETIASWAFIDPIIEYWRSNKITPLAYAKNESISHIATKLDKKVKGKIGIVGLGKMGASIADKLQDEDWQVFGYDPKSSLSQAVFQTDSLGELASKLGSKKLIWLMVPSSKVDEVLFGGDGLFGHLRKGDVVVDGGNSNYKDSILRQHKLAEKGIKFVDIGVSGGPEGVLNGPSLMVGGSPEDQEEVARLVENLSKGSGSYKFFPAPGAGHFVKMIHNGIEYGMMQSIAEGFNLMNESSMELNLEEVAKVYSKGSVIQSRLIDWLIDAFEVHGAELMNVSTKVHQTGEVSWMVEAAKEIGVDVRVIKASLDFRLESGKSNTYSGRVLSALREQFGGHSVQP